MPASFASFDSGILVIPIISQPHDLYKFDSANVENCGPSMQIYVPAEWKLSLRFSKALEEIFFKFSQIGEAIGI